MQPLRAPPKNDLNWLSSFFVSGWVFKVFKCKNKLLSADSNYYYYVFSVVLHSDTKKLNSLQRGLVQCKIFIVSMLL